MAYKYLRAAGWDHVSKNTDKQPFSHLSYHNVEERLIVVRRFATSE